MKLRLVTCAVLDKIGEENVFNSIHDAVRFILQEYEAKKKVSAAHDAMTAQVAAGRDAAIITVTRSPSESSSGDKAAAIANSSRVSGAEGDDVLLRAGDSGGRDGGGLPISSAIVVSPPLAQQPPPPQAREKLLDTQGSIDVEPLVK